MSLRQQHIQRLADEIFDVLIVGSGINGAVSAAALSARGVKVALIDARDFAGFTSQQSSNLIWGGIKYLESYEFKLVARLCKSRNTLIRHYPSAVKEIRFLTSIPKSFRRHPRMVWLGTWLYWLMGRGFTRRPLYMSAREIKRQEPAVDVSACRGGVEYSDAYLQDNDARFVFNFVRTALEKGCTASNYIAAGQVERDEDGLWKVEAEDQLDGRRLRIRSRVVINAAGAFVDEFNQANNIKTHYRHAFSKGIHLIVPRITQAKRVLAFIADDGRLFFAIPMGERTCIGTTDTPVDKPETSVTEEDRDFVLDNINAHLDLPGPLARKDIIAERCGVRPLAIKRGKNSGVDFQHLSRKHVIDADPDVPYMSIFGGKLTDCLNVGDEICDKVAALGVAMQALQKPWYGEPDEAQHRAYCRRSQSLKLDKIKLPDSDGSLQTRLWRRYGLDALPMLDQIEVDSSQATPAIEGTSLFRCELAHLAEKEMPTSLEDLLHRRSKIGLVVSSEKLKSSVGTLAICRQLFGDQAQQQFDAYFAGR